MKEKKSKFERAEPSVYDIACGECAVWECEHALYKSSKAMVYVTSRTANNTRNKKPVL